jgi:trigger factor
LEDWLKTNVEQIDGHTVKLTVTVQPDEVEEAVDKAYSRVAARVKIPGFRKGKAPRPVVDTHVGRDYVMTEATEELVQSSYSRAIDDEDLQPVEPPEIDELDTIEPGAEFVFTTSIQVRPELQLSGIEDFEIEMPPREVSDEEVDPQIEELRERFATLEPVESRGVAAEDHVLLSFTGYLDDEAYEGNQVDKYLYEMSRGLMPADFEEGLLGVEAGGETTVSFEVPETSSDPALVGKTARFEVSVHEIKTKVLPELDDDFAMNVGGFETFEELRENVRKRTELQKNSGWDRLREQRAREDLATRLVGDVPEAMKRVRTGQMLRDFQTGLETREMTLDAYLQARQTDLESFQAEIEEQAEQSVREELALEALARELDLQVTDEDVDVEFSELAAASDSTVEETRKKWEEMGLLSVAEQQALHRKSMLWLLDNVTVTEVEPDEAEAEAEQPETDAEQPDADAEDSPVDEQMEE